MENDFGQPAGGESAEGTDPTEQLQPEQLGEPESGGQEQSFADSGDFGLPEATEHPEDTGQFGATTQVPPTPRPFDTPAGWSPSTQGWRPPTEPSQPLGYPGSPEATYWRPGDAPPAGAFGPAPEADPGAFGPQAEATPGSFGAPGGYTPGPFGAPGGYTPGPFGAAGGYTAGPFGAPGPDAPPYGYGHQPGGQQLGGQQIGGHFPPGDPAFSQDPPQAQPKAAKSASHRVLVGSLIGLLVLALLGAGIGVGLAVRGNAKNSNASGKTASQTIPRPANNSGSTKGDLSIQQVVSKLEPGVVDITSVLASQDEEEAGTGMILTSNGEVMTNNHVIAEATKITARIDGKGRTYQVKVLGADPTQDVALVQLVGASGLKTVQVGNSSSVQVGESVVAIGNALDLQGPPTVTAGIISAMNRSITASDASGAAAEHLVGLLQTSAQINPGNSGGPLSNYDGQVIGMNTAADNGSSSQAANSIGFAIPINEALSIAQQMQQGHSSSKIELAHGFLGVEVLSIAEAESSSQFQQLPTPAVSSGAYVVEALPGDPANTAGITEGSVITAIDGTTISGPAQLGTALNKFGVGDKVTVKWVDTAGTTHNTTLTLVSGPLS